MRQPKRGPTSPVSIKSPADVCHAAARRCWWADEAPARPYSRRISWCMARLMAIVDVAEAISSDRPVRPGLAIEKTLAEIKRGRATAYDADAPDACLRLFREGRYQLPSPLIRYQSELSLSVHDGQPLSRGHRRRCAARNASRHHLLHMDRAPMGPIPHRNSCCVDTGSAKPRLARRVDHPTPHRTALLGSREARQRNHIACSGRRSAWPGKDPNVHYLDQEMPAMLAYVDAEQRYRYHNRAFRAILRVRSENTEGRHLREVLGATTYAEIEDSAKQALSGCTVRFERTQRPADNTVFRLSNQFLPHFGDGGKVFGFFAVQTDITALKDLLVTIPLRHVARRKKATRRRHTSTRSQRNSPIGTIRQVVFRPHSTTMSSVYIAKASCRPHRILRSYRSTRC
jgi:PAS domain-containing protein